jgi:hypothetical protein
MTFDQLWETIKQKNPMVATGDFVRMSTDQFRRALELAYDQGVKAEKERGINPDFSNMFGGIFGKRPG